MPAFSSFSREQLLFAGVGVAGVIFIGWLLFSSPRPATEGPIATSTPPILATSTASTPAPTPVTAANSPTAAKKPESKPLPPEQPFVLPEGATAVDGYAYIQNNSVYFRSLTGKQPLHVWDANPTTFHRVDDFMSYPGTAVGGDCGAAPIYTYYTDDQRLYFYQVWRTPTFRSSTVEAVPGARASAFRITGLTTSTDGQTDYQITYQKATTTCKLFLNKTTQ